MGRILAVGLAALLGLAVWLRPALPRELLSAIGPAPRCELLLADGTSLVTSPQEASGAVAAALAGNGPALSLGTPGAVSCALPEPRGPAQQIADSGLTPRAEALHREVLAVFGPLPYGGFAPGGVTSGHGARSAHYEGRAVDYFFRPVGDETQRARGWQLANWLVANAERLEVAVVIFDDRIWSTRRSAAGWRPYTNPDGGSDPISRHLDHVHVDVIAGG